jgi:hypothetical protein
VRTTISGLLRTCRPVLVMTALVAVVGVTGTAYANHKPGNQKSDSSNSSTAASQSQGQNPSHGDKGDSGGKSDRSGWSGKNWKQHKPKGHHGNGNDNGDDAEYGVATVNVSRGHDANNAQNPATTWATYSTLLGSPVGDTTGGVFRFTCSTVNAPCTVAVKGAVLSASAGTTAIYPRVLIYRQDYNAGGPEVYCEYGDGSTGSVPLALTQQALSSTPTFTAVPLNIGGSDDCGLGGPAGDVNQITVPSGYYDVHSTFTFLP